MYAGPSPPCAGGAGRRRSELGGEPVGELAGAVGRGVVDHEHAVAVAQHARRARAASPRGSRARCRSAGRRSRASAPPIIATMADLPRNDELAAQFDLLADLMELEGADAFRIGAYRKAAARIRETPTSVAQLALDGQGEGAAGDRQDDRGEDRRGRRRRRDPRADEAQGGGAGRGGDLHAAARGSARRRRGGSGRSSGSRPSTSCGRPPRRSSCAVSPGSAPGPRRRSSTALAKPQAAEGPHRALLGTTLPKLRAVVDELRAHPAAVEVSIAGSARRFRETVRDLDLIATATDPPALIEHFCSLPWVVEVAAKGDEGDRRLAGRAPLRPARRPARVLRQPAAALHRLEGPQRRAARGGGPARLLGLRVRDHRGRDAARCTASRPRRRSTASSATSGSRPSCARTAASSRPRARASCRRSSSSATCAATCTRTRPGRTARTRSRRWSRGASGGLRLLRDLRPLAPAARRPAAAAGGAIDALNELVPLRILKGIEVNIRPDGTLDVADEDLATLDWVVASVHSRFDHAPDRARLRGDGEPVRRLHRPPDEPQDRQARRRRRSTSSA